MWYLYSVRNEAKTPTVGSFRPAIYCSPVGEIEDLGALKAAYVEEMAAPLRLAAAERWGEAPLEYIDAKPPFRGGIRRKELSLLNRAIRPDLRALPGALGAHTTAVLDQSGYGRPARPAVDRLVIHDPMDLAATWSEARAVIVGWALRGDLQELFCTWKSELLICDGELVRASSLFQFMDLMAELDLGRRARKRESGTSRRRSAAPPGRPKIQVDLQAARQCLAMGASKRSVVAALCLAAEADGSAVSASTVRSRLRSIAR